MGEVEEGRDGGRQGGEEREGERVMSVHFLPLCRDGIDAVRGCVEEMKGQMPVDGATGSSRVVRR